MLINGVSFRNISKSVIPLCSVGFHAENNMTTATIGLSSINLTLNCPDCLAFHSLSLLPNSESDILHVERTFLNHTEPLPYNSSTGLYEYKNHQYEYLTSGINLGNITVRCNTTISHNSFNVTNTNLSINIISIDDVQFVNGTVVESSPNTTIIIDVFGDIIQSLQFNVTYSNGTLIKTTSSEFMILNNTELNEVGIYNISISAVDDENVRSSNKGYFIINDTVSPTTIWITPLLDNSTVADTYEIYDIRIDIQDVNLFGFQLYVRNPNNDLVLDYNITNLNSSTYQILNSINLTMTGIYILNLTVVDDHTISEISDYKFESDLGDKELTFTFDKMIEREVIQDNVTIKYVGDYDLSEINAVKVDDRYNFNYQFHLDADKFAKDVKHSFRIKCNDIVFRPNSKYKAHFVCYDSMTWIDFENDDIIYWNAKRLSDDEYEINLIMNPVEYVEFKSIGGLNSVNQVAIINSVPAVDDTILDLLNFDIDSLTSVMFMFVLVVLFLGCYFIGIAFNNFVFSSIGFFVGLILGFMFMNFSLILSLCFWFLNVGMMFYIAKMK